MHTWLRRALTVIAVVATASIGCVTYTPAASAQPEDGPCLTCGNADMSDEGLLARARTQIGELNGTNARRQECTDEHESFPEDDNDTVEHRGYIRWVLTLNEQHVWDDNDTTTGYRLECYLPDVYLDPGYDGLIEVRMFDAIAPAVLAQVAIDDMVSQIPTQEVTTSPNDETLVAIDTWFWVTGVPDGGVSATASVPGMTVVAQAQPGGILLDFGDGTQLQCPDRGTPYAPGATSNCTHRYETAGRYTVSSSILWTGTYTVNGAGPYAIPAAIPVSAAFQLAVSEAQALNTDG